MNTITKIARRPISTAFTWYKNAWCLIKNQPVILLTSVLWILFLSLIIEITLPFIGRFISTGLTPLFIFGLAIICQHIRLQKTITPLKVFSGFSAENRKQLLLLGFYLSGATFLCVMSTQFYDGGKLARLFLGFTVEGLELPKAPTFNADDLAALQASLQSYKASFIEWLTTNRRFVITNIFYQLSTLLLNILFLFAPFYIATQKYSAIESFKLSLKTIWRNCLPLLLLALLFIASAIFIYVITALLTVFFISIPFLMILLVPLFFGGTIVLTALFFSCAYSSHHDIISHSDFTE